MNDYGAMFWCGFLLTSGGIFALMSVGVVALIIGTMLGDYLNRWQTRYETLSDRIGHKVREVRAEVSRFPANPVDVKYVHTLLSEIESELNRIPKKEQEK